MSLYYSIDKDGFYNSDSGVPIPEDAIEITTEQHTTFLTKLNQENKKLTLENGSLVLVERSVIITWNSIRHKRNRLLKESDHKVMPDYPGNKQAWAEYRQALRDIPQNYSDPNNVMWPEKPSDK